MIDNEYEDPGDNDINDGRTGTAIKVAATVFNVSVVPSTYMCKCTRRKTETHNMGSLNNYI